MDPLASIELGEDFLAHYGVPGMHWGIRKNEDHTTVDPKLEAYLKNIKSEHSIYYKKKLYYSRDGTMVRPYNRAITGSAIVGAGVVGSILTTAVFPTGGLVSVFGGGAIGATAAASIIQTMGNRKLYDVAEARADWIDSNVRNNRR